MSPGNFGMLYLKKNCDGCKALEKGKCVLGYAVTTIPASLCLPGDSMRAPEEPCLKPRTYERLTELQTESESRNG